MFEDIVELWESYTAAASKTWPGDVQELAAEMRNRFIQLDIVLEHISRAARDFPAEVLATMRGESRPSRQDTLRPIVEPQLFLEMFYFVAWRIVVAIAKAPPVMFPPKGTKLNVPGITHVRNKLIEHPEQPGGIFKQSMVGTHAGPVLKGSAVVIRTATGKVEPVSVISSEINSPLAHEPAGVSAAPCRCHPIAPGSSRGSVSTSSCATSARSRGVRIG